MDGRLIKSVILDYARILVSISYLQEVNRILCIKVDNHCYKIKVVEEINRDLEHHRWEVTDYMEDDDSTWSENSEETIDSNMVEVRIADRSDCISGNSTVNQQCHIYEDNSILVREKVGALIVGCDNQEVGSRESQENNQVGPVERGPTGGAGVCENFEKAGRIGNPLNSSISGASEELGLTILGLDKLIQEEHLEAHQENYQSKELNISVSSFGSGPTCFNGLQSKNAIKELLPKTGERDSALSNKSIMCPNRSKIHQTQTNWGR